MTFGFPVKRYLAKTDITVGQCALDRDCAQADIVLSSQPCPYCQSLTYTTDRARGRALTDARAGEIGVLDPAPPGTKPFLCRHCSVVFWSPDEVQFT